MGGEFGWAWLWGSAGLVRGIERGGGGDGVKKGGDEMDGMGWVKQK